MGVLGPYFEYFVSIRLRISRKGLPCPFSSITSRVTLRQMLQVAE